MANMIAGILNPVLTLVKNINYVSLCVLGGYFYVGVHNGTIAAASFGGIGDITKFLSYSNYFSSPIINLSKIINNIQSSLASAERVFALLDEAEEEPDCTDSEDKDLSKGLVEFRDVSFRYDTADRDAVSHASFEIGRGKMVAVVGGTGSGKTTMSGLLSRFFDP